MGKEKPSDAEIISSLRVYVREGIQIHTAMRDMFVEKDNVMGAMKHQGSVDSVQDIERILNGGKVATIAEIRAEITKGEAASQGSYLG